jgi:Cdc6-like AAA superfamily ATPase
VGARQRIELEAAVSAAFSPHSPINDSKLFAGRIAQVRDVLDTVKATGLHAVIYGERGVGKTSLATSINAFLESVVSIARVNCAQGDSFSSVIRRSLRQVQLTLPIPRAGFGAVPRIGQISLLNFVPEEGTLSPDSMAELVLQLPTELLLVIDEFDRIDSGETAAFADFIKGLSDRGSQSTVLLIGVGRSVESLIANHQSVERCLRQILLPRMSDDELGEIVDRGLDQAGMRLDSPSPRNLIISISQGFPHYTHLLAQNACRVAIEDALRTTVSRDDVLGALVRAIDASDLTYREAYRKAVIATKKDTLWEQVVLACAQAEYDDLGYFSGSDVVEKLAKLIGDGVMQQRISYHLGKLIEDDRGPLLEKIGVRRRFRFRFVSPMMRPFILMKAISDGLIRPPD